MRGIGGHGMAVARSRWCRALAITSTVAFPFTSAVTATGVATTTVTITATGLRASYERADSRATRASTVSRSMGFTR
jgi:hypothetical protein